MRLKEKSMVNINVDYCFLRDNQVCGKTALRIVGLAYLEETK